MPEIVLPAECLPPTGEAHLAASDVVRAVAEAWGVPTMEVRSRSRQGRIVRARRACMVALVRLCPWLTLTQIGAAVGITHHATVLYHLRKAGVQRPLRVTG